MNKITKLWAIRDSSDLLLLLIKLLQFFEVPFELLEMGHAALESSYMIIN